MLDTDGDGITDMEELNVYGTDPYNMDTDGDGYHDLTELILGLNPLEKDDISKARTHTITHEDYDLVLKGYGNIVDVFLDKVQVKELEQSDFLIGDVLQLSSSVKFDKVAGNDSVIKSARVRFSLDNVDSPEDVGVFEYDRKSGMISWLESNIDAKKNTIDVYVDNFQVFGLAYLSKKPDQIKTEIALVIDNSGSMFSEEYVRGEASDPPSPDFGNDIEFNRLNLMEALLGELDGDKFRFSVGAFQSSYHQVTEMTDSKETVLESLERLKTEYQNFDGIVVEGAVKAGLREFSHNKFNKKYMILLTDGYTVSSLFTYVPNLEDILETANEKNVEIITIGLGDCDEELLNKISSVTDGIYVHAEDSDALLKLLDRILASLDELEIDMDGDGNKDAQMIADSGFKAEVDGFPFANFRDEDSPTGNCFGFSLTTKLIYEKSLPTELAETQLRGLAASFSDNNILNAYKMDDDSIELMKSKRTYDIKVPTLFLIDNPPSDDELRNPEEGIGVIDPKYRQSLIDMGYNIKVVDKDVEVDGVKVKKIETARLDIWSEKTLENVPATELDFIRIISRNQKAQFDSLLSRELGNVVWGKERKQTKKDLIDPMAEILGKGKPALVTMDSAYGGHAVLVTSMAYDINNPNIIYLTLYDSNAPGLNVTGTLERVAATKEGEFTNKYKFNYEQDDKLIFNTIMLKEIELLNGDEVFYKQ